MREWMTWEAALKNNEILLRQIYRDDCGKFFFLVCLFAQLQKTLAFQNYYINGKLLNFLSINGGQKFQK